MHPLTTTTLLTSGDIVRVPVRVTVIPEELCIMIISIGKVSESECSLCLYSYEKLCR